MSEGKENQGQAPKELSFRVTAVVFTSTLSQQQATAKLTSGFLLSMTPPCNVRTLVVWGVFVGLFLGRDVQGFGLPTRASPLKRQTVDKNNGWTAGRHLFLGSISETQRQHQRSVCHLHMQGVGTVAGSLSKSTSSLVVSIPFGWLPCAVGTAVWLYAFFIEGNTKNPVDEATKPEEEDSNSGEDAAAYSLKLKRKEEDRIVKNYHRYRRLAILSIVSNRIVGIPTMPFRWLCARIPAFNPCYWLAKMSPETDNVSPSLNKSPMQNRLSKGQWKAYLPLPKGHCSLLRLSLHPFERNSFFAASFSK